MSVPMIGCILVACLSAYLAGRYVGYGKGFDDGVGRNAKYVEISISGRDVDRIIESLERAFGEEGGDRW